MKKSHLLAIICLIAVLCGCSGPGSAEIEADYAIIGVTIVSVEDEALHSDRAVLIRDRKIVWTGASSDARYASTTEVIDAAGRYLIPGLSEMHAHIPYSKEGISSATIDTMMLFLSHGITNIRGLKGHESHLSLREQTASGEIVGPRITTCGARLNSDTVKSVEAAREIVKQQFEAGYDFIKIHRNLTPELFHAIADQADELGIRIAGHVPETVGIREALQRDFHTIEHFDGYMEGLAPDDMEVLPFQNGTLFALPLAPKADLSKIDELVALTKEKGTWMVPTSAWLERSVTPRDPQVYLSEPGMAYSPKGSKERLYRVKTKRNQTVDPKTAAAYVSVRRTLLKKMSEGGVGLLFGCDAPQFGNVPGFSMHHEVKEYQAAGLSDWEILKMATINPAIFAEQTDTFGAIRTGLDADLVLLERNPVENMENLKNPIGVMLRGRWLTRAYFDAELEKIAAKHR